MNIQHLWFITWCFLCQHISETTLDYLNRMDKEKAGENPVETEASIGMYANEGLYYFTVDP